MSEEQKQTQQPDERGEDKKKKNQLAIKSIIISWVLIGIYLGVTIPLHFKYENFSTHWLLFGLFALVIPCGAFNFMLQGLTLQDIPKERIVKSTQRLIMLVAYLWLLDLFYMVSFNNWLVWIYALGIILLLIAIRNLIKVFLGKTEVFKKFILVDLLIALILTAFLIYKIPEKYGSLQSIVTTIVAAVYGGMLTLTGVAWTIKRQDEIRKEDIAKREEERKQEEIERAKPIFTCEVLSIPQYYISELPRCEIEVYKNAEDMRINTYGQIDNSEHSTIKLEKLYFKKWVNIKSNNLVLKNKSVILQFKTPKRTDEWDEFCFLQVKDCLGNKYYYKLYYDTQQYSGKLCNKLYDIVQIPKEEAPDDNN